MAYKAIVPSFPLQMSNAAFCWSKIVYKTSRKVYRNNCRTRPEIFLHVFDTLQLRYGSHQSQPVPTSPNIVLVDSFVNSEPSLFYTFLGREHKTPTVGCNHRTGGIRLSIKTMNVYLGHHNIRLTLPNVIPHHNLLPSNKQE